MHGYLINGEQDWKYELPFKAHFQISGFLGAGGFFFVLWAVNTLFLPKILLDKDFFVLWVFNYISFNYEARTQEKN